MKSKLTKLRDKKNTINTSVSLFPRVRDLKAKNKATLRLFMSLFHGRKNHSFAFFKARKNLEEAILAFHARCHLFSL